MAIYLGFLRPLPETLQERFARARAGEPLVDTTFAKLVNEFPSKLPASCTIVGSYTTQSGAVIGDPPPDVMIVETDNQDDLFFISRYYYGYSAIQWFPARSVGRNRQERDAIRAGMR